MPRARWLSGLVVALALPAGACTSGNEPWASEAEPLDAQEAVLAAFDEYQVVGGFSAGHGNKGTDDFLLDLIRNPDLPTKVDDIAIECGNALFQDVLDRFIAGEDVPLSEVQPVWRNTTQGANCGFSTFYEQLIPLVRRLNENLPAEQKLRVLACDPPVDWSQPMSSEEFEAGTDRTASTVEIMEREVLSRDRNALMLYGIHHMQHLEGTAVGTYEANGSDGITYVIGDHFGFANRSPLGADNDELEARMASWPNPAIIEIEGSWLADLDSEYFNEPPGEQGFPGVDAYLYTGPRDTLLREPQSAQAMLDADYIAELERRAAMVGRADGPMAPSDVLRREAEASVFSYEPQSAQ
jgi:hypothetical protein